MAAELLDLVEAITGMHHEAGHAAAACTLTPASKVRLVRVTFDPQEIAVPGFEQFAAVEREATDSWPQGEHEALLELTCLLAGPPHTPWDEDPHGQAHMRQDMADLRREVQPRVGGRQVGWEVAPLPVVKGDGGTLRTLVENALKFT